MKRYFLLGLIAALSAEASFGAVVHQGSASVRIEKLLAEKQAKLKKLESCKGTTKNLKIAGLSTLGITAAGVVVNVAEAVELNKKEKELTEAQKKHDTALEKNQGIVKAQKEENSFKEWCSGDGKTYTESDKSCTISQSDDSVTGEDTAKTKIQKIVGGTCADISQNGNTYTATCKKDGHDVSVTITGKAAGAQPVQQKSEDAKVEDITGEEGVGAKEEPAKVKNEVAKTPAAATNDADTQFEAACKKLKSDGYNFGTGDNGKEQYCRVDLSKQGINGDANRKAKVKDLATRLEGVTCDSTKIVPHTTDANQMVMNCNNATNGKFNRFFVRFGASAAPVAQNAGKVCSDEGFITACNGLGARAVSTTKKDETMSSTTTTTYCSCVVNYAGRISPEDAEQVFMVNAKKFVSTYSGTPDKDIEGKVLAMLAVDEDTNSNVYKHLFSMKFTNLFCAGDQVVDEDFTCKCENGGTLNAGTQKCECAAGKAINKSTNKCDAAPGDNWYIANGVWTACPATKNATTNKTGCTCAAGEGTNTYGQCIKCDATTNNGYIDDEGVCQICQDGTTANQDNHECDEPSA